MNLIRLVYSFQIVLIRILIDPMSRRKKTCQMVDHYLPWSWEEIKTHATLMISKEIQILNRFNWRNLVLLATVTSTTDVHATETRISRFMTMQLTRAMLTNSTQASIYQREDGQHSLKEKPSKIPSGRKKLRNQKSCQDHKPTSNQIKLSSLVVSME